MYVQCTYNYIYLYTCMYYIHEITDNHVHVCTYLYIHVHVYTMDLHVYTGIENGKHVCTCL